MKKLKKLLEATLKIKSNYFNAELKDVKEGGTSIIELSLDKRPNFELGITGAQLSSANANVIKAELTKLDDYLDDMVNRIESKIS